MNKPLRILHLEDDPDFSDLVRTLLESEGLPAQLTLVGTRAEFEAALDHETFDIILADYVLPGYNGSEALHCARCEIANADASWARSSAWRSWPWPPRRT